jgi:hypothetical protein
MTRPRRVLTDCLDQVLGLHSLKHAWKVVALWSEEAFPQQERAATRR